MTEKIKMNQIYETVISRIPLTKELLISYGLNETEIINLINLNILKSTENNEYKLASVEGLITYSIKLINIEQYERGIQALEICHEIEPSNREVGIQLLQVCIKKRKYQKAWEAFSWIDNSKEPREQKDNNLYLYLLSIVSNYPEEYRERVTKIKHEDVVLLNTDNSPHLNISAQNQMRIAIIQNKLSKATRIFNNDLRNSISNKAIKIILTELLSQAMEVEKRKTLLLHNLATFRDYPGIVSFIEKQREKGKVSLYYGFIYYIARKIIIISNTKQIPEVKVENTDSLKEALLGDNYELALKLNNIRANQTSENQEKNIVTILLKEINTLIKKLKQEETSRETQLNSIIKLLEQNKYEQALQLIEEYLKIIKKSEYQFIVLNLIKISSLENDKTFVNVKAFLKELSNPNYRYNSEEYIKKFYESIEQNNFEAASIYLDILTTSSTLIKEQKCIENLEFETMISSLSNILNQSIKIQKHLLEHLETLKKSNDPSIILTGIPKEERLRMVSISKNIKGLSIDRLGKEEPKPILLRYIEQPLKDEDLTKLQNEGIKAYLDKNYELSIQINSVLFKFVANIKPRLCTILGLSYLNLGNIDLAIKYLTLANTCSKNRKSKYHVSNRLLESLTKPFDENTETEISTFTSKFDTRLTNYDIDKLQEIAYYIKECGISQEEAIISFRLTEEHINIIKLIYARDCYTEEDYKQGDAICREVEKVKNKSAKVTSLLNELRTNRKFYKNRINSNKRSLKPNNQ